MSQQNVSAEEGFVACLRQRRSRCPCRPEAGRYSLLSVSPLFTAAASASASSGVSDAVAIVALIVTGAAGIVGAAVLYLNTGRTIKAEEQRQTALLVMEQNRHESSLRAERARLDATLNAEDERLRWHALREVLDQGAVLLTPFQAMTNSLRQTSPGQLDLPVGWDETVEHVGIFRGRLRLWFDDEDEAVKAFDALLAAAVWTSELREGIDDASWLPPQVSRDAFEKIRPRFAEYIQQDVETHRDEYLAAARAHLRAAASP